MKKVIFLLLLFATAASAQVKILTCTLTEYATVNNLKLQEVKIETVFEFFYSEAISDLPHLQVKNSYEKLLKKAEERNWEAIVNSRPVAIGENILLFGTAIKNN